MQSLFAILALLVGAATANSLFFEDQSRSQQSTPAITSSEYLQKALSQNGGGVGLGSRAMPFDDVPAKLTSLGLQEAAQIAQQVNLWQILEDCGYSSVTLFMPSNRAVQQFKQQAPDIAANRTALATLVKAGIVRGKITSSALANDQKVQSKEGAKLRVNIYNKGDQKVITVNGAQITKPDQDINNGVIHVINKMIFPLPRDNIMQTLANVDSFSTMLNLVQRANLGQTLSNTDPMTILVPLNKAFQLLPSGALDDLRANPEKLQNLLKYHVISSSQYSAGLKDGQRISATQGDAINVQIENGQVMLANQNTGTGQSSRARVIQADIPATNGVIHVIDQVLVPPERHYILV